MSVDLPMSVHLDDTALPAGKTCGDCRHITRCKTMFGHVETDIYCDWSPSRFREPINPGTHGIDAAYRRATQP